MLDGLVTHLRKVLLEKDAFGIGIGPTPHALKQNDLLIQPPCECVRIRALPRESRTTCQRGHVMMSLRSNDKRRASRGAAALTRLSRLAAMASILAQRSGGHGSDRAMLAGLVQDLGMLPLIAALGGMVLPAGIYLAFNLGRRGEAGCRYDRLSPSPRPR